MSVVKQIKDKFIKFVLGKNSVPSGLSDLHSYFRLYKEVNFEHNVGVDGNIIAVSTDFKYGTIIATAKNLADLNDAIEDAILTAFEVPSSYTQEASIHRVDDKGYAFA